VEIGVLRTVRNNVADDRNDKESKSNMSVGTVKWFNSVKGYGFISPDDGSKDAFVHISAVERAGLPGLAEGQRVEFELQPGKNGKSSAENLVLVE
jgi:CspA family cold shock protein